jgi:mannosyltransferase
MNKLYRFYPHLIFATGIVLRVIPVWRDALWYDENFTLLVARLPWDRFMQAIAGDVHPPLFYLLLRPLAMADWLPVWTLRLPSVAFSIGALFLFWKIMNERCLWHRNAMLALAIFALLPQQIYYAQEARMYAMLTFLVMAAWLAIIMEKWVLLGFLASALLWTHNYGPLYITALFVAGVVFRPRTFFPMFLAFGLAALSWIPWVSVLIRQMSEISGNYWILPLGVDTVIRTISFIVFIQSTNLGANILNASVFLGWLIFSLVYFWRNRDEEQSLPEIAIAFLPWILSIVISIFYQPIVLFRALVPCGAFLVLLLVRPLGWEMLRSARSKVLALIFIAPALLINAAGYYVYPEAIKDYANQIKTLAHYINANSGPEDIVLHAGDSSWINMVPYMPDVRHIKLSGCGSVAGGLSDQTRQALGEVQGTLEGQNYRRAWIMTLETPMTPTCESQMLGKYIADTEPLFCIRDDVLIRTCLYLVKP